MPLIPFRKKPTASRQIQGVKTESPTAVKPASSLSISEMGSSQGQRINDPLPELSNPTIAARTYKKMERSDASVRISIRAGKAPVLGADYYVDPCDNTPDAELPAEFVAYNLFEGMTVPFKQFVDQVLKMYVDGWSPFEQVWELREWAGTSPGAVRRKYTMLRKLAYRPPSTINKVVYDDNGGPLELWQNAVRADGKSEVVKIPIEKLVIFTFDKDGADVTGNSILRSAYQHWYYKDYLYKIDAIQKERHGIGIPDIELQPGFSENDKKFAHELGRNLRTNENSYIVRTPMLKIGFAELKGQLVNALESAEHHDNMIMKNIMVQFLNMGVQTQGGGGRATGATAMDMFLKAMRYIAQSIICDSINMYLIPQMVAYNFKTDKFPQLKVRNVGETKDLQMWAAAMSNLIKNEAIQLDDDTEQWIRAQVDMPKRTTPYKEETQTQQPATPSNDNQDGNSNTNANGKSNKAGPGTTSGYVGKSPSSPE